MCRQADVQHAVGGWVQFRTPWGTHRGIVEQVNSRAVLMKVPREYAPALAFRNNGPQADETKLDAALAFGGYRPAYGAAPGYGAGGGVAGPGYGARWGYPGYGGWFGGWWWWWIAFVWIFFLAFLWW